MTYKASWNNFTKIVTAAVTILFIGIIISPYFSESRGNQLGHYIISGSLILIYVICYLLSPIDYSIESGKLIIRRPWKNVVIDRDKITHVELLKDEKLKKSIRTFGSGGLFGFFGKFYNAKIGNMIWYATRMNRVVLVQAENKNIILTPDEAEDFVKKLRARKTAWQ
jgi:hypothetical protein